MANEKRLVGLNSVIEQLENEWGYEGIREDLYKLPTVDAVEVVRCKDCKHWKKCESSLIGEAMCCTGQGSANILKAPTDFCSYGERREGE